MTRAASKRRAMGLLATTSLVTFALGLLAAGLVAGLATAASTTSTQTATTSTSTSTSTDPNSPSALYFVINGSADAASDHEIVGSSAFPNYATGAVDNYYSMARTHVDNSPFAEGKASPADTGPVGQTAAAGNTQQPQYADARWPGDSGKATYGSQGSPYATATAGEYDAKAESSEASTGLNGTGGSTRMAVPNGFDTRLRQALSSWKAQWLGRLRLAPPAAASPPAITVPTPVATVTTPTVSTPSLPVPTPVPAPSVSVPQPALPRSLQSSTSPPPADGAALLESSSHATVDPTSHALVTSGESSLGRVSIGGGQIVLQGIHVSASVANDGKTPTDKIAITVAHASVAGIPVTIDQDGVHVSGQAQGLPYGQASDALNGALKQAGIRLFLVAPEITNGGSCDGGGTGTGTTTTSSTTTSSTTTTTTSDSGACPGSDGGGTTTDTTTTDSTTTTDTTTTATTTTAGTGTCTPTTGTTGTTTGTTTDTTSSTTTDTTPTTTSSLPGFGTGSSGGGGGNPNELKITATGVHVAFTQPVDQPGVPAQYVEHILGEVSLDSLAVPAGGTSGLPDLGLNLNLGGSSGFGSSSCKSAAGHRRSKGTKKSVAGSLRGGGSSTGGTPSAGGAPASSGFASGSSSSGQPAASFTSSGAVPTSGTTAGAVPAAQSGFISALRKPKWLLVAYLVWQALMIATGASVWHWRKGGAA